MTITPLNWGPKPLRKWSMDVATAIKKNMALGGPGIAIEERSDGRVINVLDDGSDDSTRDQGAGSQSRHPFQIVMVDDVSALVREGTIYDGLTNWNESLTITGFDSTFTVTENDYVWIVGTVSSGVTTAAEVGSGISIPARTLYSEGAQTQWTVLLGQIVQSDGRFVPSQFIHTNLTIAHMCLSGNAAIYPAKR